MVPVLFLLYFMWGGSIYMEEGLASCYSPWKEQYMEKNGRRVQVSNGIKPYCNWFRYKYLPSDPLIAHRSLPCGTHVLLYNKKTGRSAAAIVGGRGPYGAIGWRKRGHIYCREPGKGRKKGWCVKRPKRLSGPRDPGRWRGVADMTLPVRRAGMRCMSNIVIITSFSEIARARKVFRRRRGKRAR